MERLWITKMVSELLTIYNQHGNNGDMQLIDYLKKHDLTQAEFARRVKESAQNINRYVKRKRIPSDAEVMQRINVVTGGEVTANDFYNIAAPPGKKQNGRHNGSPS